MPTYIGAGPEHAIETSQDMDPVHPGARVMPGLARGHLTVHGPGDECSDTLPTVGELLALADPATGLVSIERYTGLPLRVASDALGALDPGLRVSPGCSFVTHEALARRPAQ